HVYGRGHAFGASPRVAGKRALAAVARLSAAAARAKSRAGEGGHVVSAPAVRNPSGCAPTASIYSWSPRWRRVTSFDASVVGVANDPSWPRMLCRLSATLPIRRAALAAEDQMCILCDVQHA